VHESGRVVLAKHSQYDTWLTMTSWHMAYASINASIHARIDNRKEVFTMSPLFNLIAFVLMSLTVSATPSLSQNDLLISEQRSEAADKNVIKSEKVKQSIGTDETLTNSSVTDAFATQEIASIYYLDALYADAACSSVIDGSVLPLDFCLASSEIVFTKYTYSSVDKTIYGRLYSDNKCTGEGYVPEADNGYVATLNGSCTPYTSLFDPKKKLYSKDSVIPSISTLNTAIFLIRYSNT
jgi:hypothetical protein